MLLPLSSDVTTEMGRRFQIVPPGHNSVEKGRINLVDTIRTVPLRDGGHDIFLVERGYVVQGLRLTEAECQTLARSLTGAANVA